MLSPVSTLCLAAANLFVGTPNHESWMDRHESRQRINGILMSPAGFCRDSIVMDPISENALPPVIRLIAFNEDTTNPETLVDSDTDRSQSTNQTFTPFKRNSLEGSPSNDAILQGIEAGISRSGESSAIISGDDHAEDGGPFGYQESAASAGRWIAATKLHQELEFLKSIAQRELDSPFEIMVSNPINPPASVYLAEWVDEMSRHLHQLESLDAIGDPSARRILERMKQAAVKGSQTAESYGDSSSRKPWLCTAYSVERRADVWLAVWNACQIETENSATSTSTSSQSDQALLVSQINEIRQMLSPSQSRTGKDSSDWERFLLLNELEINTSERTTAPASTESKVIAQRILTRIDQTVLTEGQQEWLTQPTIVHFIETLHTLASSKVDYEKLLLQIEQLEINSVNQFSKDLADTLQDLKFSKSHVDREIAHHLDTHYRNANFRIAIRDEFLNRILPSNEPMTVPIRTRAMGATIHGESQIQSELGISLTPSPDSWNMVLRSIGDITTLSTGHQSVVEIHTTGKANFQSGTPVTVSQNGINYEKTDVDVSGRLRLRRVESDLDDYPILGGFVRAVAERRFETVAPEANRISNRTVRNQIRAEIDQTLDQQTKTANQKLDELVVQPLVDMKLAPHVTQMQTTEEMLMGRFRVAGEWQMAAFTPRPRPPQDSLLNIQLHQSAINNTLEKLLPSGETMPIEEVLRQIAASFGQENFQMPEDMPEGVEIRFSTSHPVSVEIEDGMLMLTLRIVQMTRGRAVDLRNVIITATYRPEVSGLHAYFVRDGHLSITGPNMSMRKRLPARTIFNKVLSTNHPLPITPNGLEERDALAGLSISQLALERGWIGLALSEKIDSQLALSP